MTVITDRLSILDRLILDEGSHVESDLFAKAEKAACIMEAAAYLAGEPWSDSPRCVSPVLTSFGIRLNDALPEDKRQLLKPFIPDLIGTRDDGHDDARRDLARQWLMADWLPKWLRLAKLEDLAVKAEQSADLTGSELRQACRSISDLTWQARKDYRAKLTAEIEKRLREKWAAEPPADAVADAVADVVAVAAADAVAVAAAVADADAVADAAAAAVAAADADAVAAAAAAAVAAAVAVAVAVAVADAVAGKKLGYNDLYWPIRRALEKHYAESDTFAEVRALRDAQLESSVELYGRMVRVGQSASV